MVFNSARLSALLSLAYVQAVGHDKMPRYRKGVQDHCARIFTSLSEIYGGEDHDEWPGSAIQKEIDHELRTNAPLEVHEAFIELKINEFEDPVAQRRKDGGAGARPAARAAGSGLNQDGARADGGWNRFAARPQAPMALVDAEHIDPVWAVELGKDSAADPQADEAQPTGLMGQLGLRRSDAGLNSGATNPMMGVPAGTDRTPKANKDTGKAVALRRSEWISFWRDLPKQHIPWHIWERHILALEPVTMRRTPEGWWQWWQDQIDVAMRSDPRLYELRRAAWEWKCRMMVDGRSWLAALQLDELEANEGAPGAMLVAGRVRLDHTPTGQAWYRRLAVEHLKACMDQSGRDTAWDWAAVQKALRPDRDVLVQWKAWQDMHESLALWPARVPGAHTLARELPQWAWMRFAMSMASYEHDSDNPTRNAVDMYEYVSQLALIPSSACLRDAGVVAPRFLEDQAWSVPDNFDGIQQVIHSTAVDTKWTGTTAAQWSRVRSKNAPVRSGRRKGAGVNDFVRTINAHLQSQGRMGDDRPVTVHLPMWHRDVEEFMTLRHDTATRVQTTVLVPDIFMQRVAENGTWTLVDPHFYPEVVQGGTEGYLQAERAVDLRKKQHPTAHKTVSAERLWKKLLNQTRLGAPCITFVDSDRAYAPIDGADIIHGLDGVGAFPVVGGDQTQAQVVQWPALAININRMISDQGEPLLDTWRETITWAFWAAERMYEACQDSISPTTRTLRPLCLGAVGFYEAIQKAMMGSHQQPEMVATWVARISEAWATLVTVVDQAFCQKYGPAPLWLGPSTKNRRAFHPEACFERLKKQRMGGLGLSPVGSGISDLFGKVSQHRFSVRTVWAPFRQAAGWAGVSPGGFGTLFPVEWVVDDQQIWRLTPTPFLLSELEHGDSNADYGAIFSQPEQPSAWPARIRQLCAPDMPEWRVRLHHASLVRPWVDQGVSLTLPAGLVASQLSILLQQAWWLGLSNVRFEDPFRKPDLPDAGRDDPDPSAQQSG